MAKSPRNAVAQALNRLTDGLNPEKDDDVAEAAEEARDMLSLLMEREDFSEERIRRYDTGTRVRVKMARGDSPRDQDEWVLEAEGETPEETQRQFDEMLDRYVEDWSDAVREIDPYSGD